MPPLPPPDDERPAPPAGPTPDRGDSARSGSNSDDQPTRVSDGQSPGPPADVVPLGPSIEGYLLKEEIHRGGQGVVYRAIQLGTKRVVALKVLLEGPFASETTRRRFEREIELAASLRHANIVTILNSGLSQGRYFFAMEYIDGLRLDRYVAQNRPSLPAALTLFERICLAVNFAHQRGVIHRDLKPQNILVDKEGEPHVLDFGLAKPVNRLMPNESTIQVLSLSGQLLGTVAYMSPEQAAGSQDVDVRSDVYSLGVIFYDALVGQPPYPVDGPLGEVLQRITHDEPANPRSLAGCSRTGLRIDDEVATILLRALEKEPQRRYQSAGELARDLRHKLEGQPIEAKRSSGLYLFKKTLRRYRLQAATAGLILLMLIGFLITFAAMFSAERDARRSADEKRAEAAVANERQRAALEEAKERTAEALLAQDKLQRALVREQIQRGDLALQRQDMIEARDSYWSAMDVASGPAAIWALRRYYLQTANSGATSLAPELAGPAVLSPSGELVAVCSGPATIWVREVSSARLVNAVSTPGPCREIRLEDDGALAAAGPGWARAWPPGALHASVAVSLPESETPAARVGPPMVCPVEQGSGLVLLQRRSVVLHRGEVGQTALSAPLVGTPIGPAAYEPQRRLLAIPSSAGVELISLDTDELKNTLAWDNPPQRPRAVRFEGPDTLAALTDAVYLKDLTGDTDWERFGEAIAPDPAATPGTPIAKWDLFDIARETRTLALATSAGHVAVASGATANPWRFKVEHLTDLHLASDDRAVLTLDDRGTLTRWIQPERIEQRRQLLQAVPAAWASSADGSTVLMAVARGRVVAYNPARSRQLLTVLRPRLLRGPAGLGEDTVSLAVNDDGTRALIRDGNTLRFHYLDQDSAKVQAWSHPKLTVADHAALSSDGELAAFLVRTPMGEQQQVVLTPWPADADDHTGVQPVRTVDLVGAAVRDLDFVPRTHTLIITRSNGQLLALDGPVSGASAEATEAATSAPTTLWVQLDSPATQLSFSRAGEYAAVASEDGLVRLFSTARREIRHRMRVDQPVSALAFNPRDDVLLIRTADGNVRLCDPATAEDIAAWEVPANTAHPLATWIGDADALLLGYGGGVFEHRYEVADMLIERSRPFALQRRIAAQLTNGDFDAAWTTGTELTNLNAQLGRWAHANILDIALRRPHVEIRPEWAADLLDASAPAALYVQLGQAAYAGERFELAGRWLQEAVTRAGDDIDAFTLRRLAECSYLAGAYTDAAAGLAMVQARADADPSVGPTVALERVAALVFAGRLAEARQAAGRVDEPDQWQRRGDAVAAASARILARMLTGLEDESLASAALDGLLTRFDERSLLYLDDVPFFSGELARQRGDLAAAAVQYQRCIDLARDTWPANWARYRLAQLNKPAT